MEAEQVARGRYKDRSGASGVTHYAFDATSICVWFVEGGAYVYDYDKPGLEHVEEMKRLAIEGQGLATYINQHVRANYAEKL